MRLEALRKLAAAMSPDATQERLKLAFLEIETPPSPEEKAHFEELVTRGGAFIRNGKFGLKHHSQRFEYGNVDLKSGWIFSDMIFPLEEWLVWCARELEGWSDPSGKTSVDRVTYADLLKQRGEEDDQVLRDSY